MKWMKCLYACCIWVLAACGSDKDPVTYPPEVTTGNVADIYREGATLYGSIQNQADADILEYGILCSDHQSMDEPKILVSESADYNNFKVTIRNLSPGETYYYCAYATSGYSVMKGEVKTFNTTDSNPPVFDGVRCELSSENGFTVSAHIEDIGAHELLLCGFCYKEADASDTDPTIADRTVYVEELGVDYSFPVKGLVPNTTYRIRAFAGNARGVGYSDAIEVTTDVATVPGLSEITVDALSVSGVVVSAKVWLPEGEELSEAGFCWSSESSMPTIEHAHLNVLEQMQGNKISCRIEGLKPETVFYVRPYAISTTNEICYGEPYRIKTDAVIVPDVTPGDSSIDDLPTVVL